MLKKKTCKKYIKEIRLDRIYYLRNYINNKKKKQKKRREIREFTLDARFRMFQQVRENRIINPKSSLFPTQIHIHSVQFRNIQKDYGTPVIDHTKYL